MYVLLLLCHHNNKAVHSKLCNLAKLEIMGYTIGQSKVRSLRYIFYFFGLEIIFFGYSKSDILVLVFVIINQ